MRKKKICSLGVGVTSVALCASTMVFAQQEAPVAQAASPATRQPVHESSTEARQLEPVTVTATRHKQLVLDVPATVNVINRHEMDDRHANNIQELIRYQPGIQVDRQVSGVDPYGNLSGFSIRGVGGNRVQVQVDGSRVIERIQDGNRDFVDLSMMKSVDIMRGPGSVLWGADALAGIVSYTTMDPDDLLRGRSFGARANVGYDGLNEHYTQTGMLGVKLADSLQWLVGYTHRTYSEVRLDNARADGEQWGCTRIGMGCDRLNPLDARVDNVLSKLVWRPDADHEIKLTGEFFESDSDVSQLYDKYITTTTMGVKTTNGDYLRNQNQMRKRFALEHEWLVNHSMLDNIKWRLSYSPQKRELRDTRYQTRKPPVVPLQNVVTSTDTDYSEEFKQIDIQLTSSFKAGDSEHRLTYGFQGDITDTDYWRKTVTNNLGLGTSTTVYASNFSNAETTRADLFFQDEISLFNRNLTVTPGLRFANYTIDPRPGSKYTFIPGKEPREMDSNEIIPQLSMLLKLDSQYSVYARYAEGFKMPTAQQLFTSQVVGTINILPNPNLQPEKVRSYEAGVRGQFEKGWFSVGTFYSDYTDFIKSLQLIPGPTGSNYTSLNVSKVRIWGLEASGEWRFAKNWALSSSASYQYGKEMGSAADKYVPFSGASPLNGVIGIKGWYPDWNLSGEFLGTFSKGITRTTKDTNYKPSGYSVFDTYVHWQPEKRFRVSAFVRNIFDKRYFEYNAATLDDIPTGPSAANVIRTDPLELHTAPGRVFGISLQANF